MGRHRGSQHKRIGEPRELSAETYSSALPWVDESNHDTVAMVAVDEQGSVAAGASSNGASHKVWHSTKVVNLSL